MMIDDNWQTNFQIFNDAMFSTAQTSIYGQFVPRAWVNKQMTMSSSTIKSLLGYQKSIKTTKGVLLGLCYGFGILGLCGGGFLLYKWKTGAKKDGLMPPEDE
jgi:hypothetical protein